MAKLGRLTPEQKREYVENVRKGYRLGRSRNDIADHYHYGKETVQTIIRNYMTEEDTKEHERNKYAPYLIKYQLHDNLTEHDQLVAYKVRLRRDPSYEHNLVLARGHYNQHFKGPSKKQFTFLEGSKDVPSITFERLRPL